jgi:carbonic anhydrase
MVDNTWETRYAKTADNKYRDFNMGGDVNYIVCNIYCNIDITKLEEKDYIKGISATSSANLLHLNPVVNTAPPQKGLQAVGINTGTTTKRTKNVYIKYRFKGKGGLPDNYELIDIFIRTPSKVVLAGKRYPMEVCLIFTSSDSGRFLVMCVPMKAAPINTTDDPLQKNLFTMLLAISNNFPSKGKTYSIENSPNWDPRVFIPIKTRDNASFYTWIDPTTNNKVMYIQFVNPIITPYKFFETFATTLSGGVNVVNQTTDTPAQKEYAGLEIRYNKNEPNVNIETTFSCNTTTNPLLQQLVNFNKEAGKTDEKEQKKADDVKTCDTQCKKDTFWKYFGIIAAVVAVFAFILIIYVLYRTRKLRLKKIKETGLGIETPTIVPGHKMG